MSLSDGTKTLPDPELQNFNWGLQNSRYWPLGFLQEHIFIEHEYRGQDSNLQYNIIADIISTKYHSVIIFGNLRFMLVNACFLNF